MKTAAVQMSVWVADGVAVVRIGGRATFAASCDFKALMAELQARGIRRFVLDLGACLLMDSTFVGVVATNGLALANGSAPGGPGSIQLLNPRPNVTDLVVSLGIAYLFKFVHADPPEPAGQQAVEAPSGAHDRQEVTRTSLEAHELLMALNPANVAKFTDVARFLAEDLRRMESGGTQ